MKNLERREGRGGGGEARGPAGTGGSWDRENEMGIQEGELKQRRKYRGRERVTEGYRGLERFRKV